jgi:hypothetical protein
MLRLLKKLLGVHADTVAEENARDALTTRSEKYIPNYVSLDARALCFFLALFLLLYSIVGLFANELWVVLPGRRRLIEIRFHGIAAWFAAISLSCAAISVASIIADHHDRRDNELSYKLFYRSALLIAAIAMAVAISFEKHA